jgi:hypothetical protein
MRAPGWHWSAPEVSPLSQACALSLSKGAVLSLSKGARGSPPPWPRMRPEPVEGRARLARRVAKNAP